MNIDDGGVAFIKAQEGFRSDVYADGAGNATIGFGHKILPGTLFKVLTESQATDLLMQDLEPVTAALTDLIKVDVSQNEFNALCSFTYNVGIGSLQNSTLLKLLNGGHYDLASCQFTRWCHINLRGAEIISPGLLRRRHAEQDLFNNQEGVSK